MTSQDRPRRRVLRILAAAAGCGGLVALARGGQDTALPMQEWHGNALGAAARILLLHSRPEAARQAMAVVMAEIDRLESEFSLFRPDSALLRLNREGRLDRPSLDMRRLLAEAVRFGDLTGGVFDVTVQPLWQLLARHFGQGGAGELPRADLAAARGLVDYRAVEISAGAVRLTRPGMAITLNGIAQGYITDRVTELLCDLGLPEVLVDIGEIRAPGTGTADRPWRIGLAHPAIGGSIEIGLARAAVATSCGRASPFTADGRWHHILDPRTGDCPPADRAASAIAPTAMMADALATVFTLLPSGAAPELLHRLGARRAVISEPEHGIRDLS